MAALLFFATGGYDWTFNMGFLSNASICDWVQPGGETDAANGLGCDDDGSLTKIRLGTFLFFVCFFCVLVPNQKQTRASNNSSP